MREILSQSALDLRKKTSDRFSFKQDLQNVKNNLLYGHKNNSLNCGLILGNMNTGAYRGGDEFDPDSIAGLVHWYDANDASTITKAADRVSAWASKGSSGNILAQGTGADQPLWVDAVQNGKPIIRFDGTSEFMADLTTSAYAQPNTLFIVCTSPSTDGRSIFDGGGSTRNLFNRQSTNTYRIYAGTGANGGTASTNMQIFRVLFSNGSGELDINGSSILTGQTIGTQSLQTCILAAFDSAGASGFANIDIAEVLVYNASLSAGDKTSVLNYLNSKWAVY